MVGIAAMLIVCCFKVAVENRAEVDQAATLSTPDAVISHDQTATVENLVNVSQQASVVAVIDSISPLPKSNVERVRKRKFEGALLLTGSPFKQKVLEQAQKKESGKKQNVPQKQQKKQQKRKRRRRE